MAGKGQADQRGDEDKRCLQADWSPQATDPERQQYRCHQQAPMQKKVDCKSATVQHSKQGCEA